MPAFNQVYPYGQVAVSGTPAYFYGSLDTHAQDTLMQVTNVALTSNVATLSVLVRPGNIPIVGNIISVKGTTNTSGLFNVTRAVLPGVTITAATGVGTVTFAL